MNPVDHLWVVVKVVARWPSSCDALGYPTKGYKTRAKKKPSGRLIIKSRGQK
jgi:ribosomal protein L2